MFDLEDDKDEFKETVYNRFKEQLKGSSEVWYEAGLLCKPGKEDLKANWLWLRRLQV